MPMPDRVLSMWPVGAWSAMNAVKCGMPSAPDEMIVLEVLRSDEYCLAADSEGEGATFGAGSVRRLRLAA